MLAVVIIAVAGQGHPGVAAICGPGDCPGTPFRCIGYPVILPAELRAYRREMPPQAGFTAYCFLGAPLSSWRRRTPEPPNGRTIMIIIIRVRGTVTASDHWQ